MKRLRDTRACASALSYYVPRQQIPHRRVIPSPTARRADTASVQCCGDSPRRSGAGGLYLAHHRQHVRRKGLCCRPVDRYALRLHVGQIVRLPNNAPWPFFCASAARVRSGIAPAPS